MQNIQDATGPLFEYGNGHLYDLKNEIESGTNGRML